MTRKTKMHELRDYIIIGLAMIEGSIGLNLFLLPNHITMGGVGGIASIFCWGFGIPASVTYLALNVFLLLIAFSLHRDSYGRYDSFASRSAFYGDSHRCLLHGKQCWIGSWM